MPLCVVSHPRIATRNDAGQPNRFLLPVWNVHEATLPGNRTPQQNYVTVCAAGARKSPHRQLKRWGNFTCPGASENWARFVSQEEATTSGGMRRTLENRVWSPSLAIAPKGNKQNGSGKGERLARANLWCAPRFEAGPFLVTTSGPFLGSARVTCVKGNVRVEVRTPAGYEVAPSGDPHSFATIEVPAGCPALIENTGEIDAYVINTPSPAWKKDDVDDHPVEGWDFAG